MERRVEAVHTFVGEDLEPPMPNVPTETVQFRMRLHRDLLRGAGFYKTLLAVAEPEVEDVSDEFRRMTWADEIDEGCLHPR